MVEHGTPAGYVAHYRAGGKPCDECRVAKRAYDKDYHARARINGHNRGSALARILETVSTNYPVSYTELEALLPDISASTLRRAFYRLENAGELKVLKNGRLVSDVGDD